MAIRESIQFRIHNGLSRSLAILGAAAITGVAFAGMGQKTPAQQTASVKQAASPLRITRANLAKSASFVVTQTIAPAGGSPLIRKFTIEVKGEKARLDYEDAALGPVRYVANEKGVFFFMPGNNSAVKQTFKGGVEGALKVAFAQANERMAQAKKVGTATVSGQPTVLYKDPETGTLIYFGTRPGFRLPIKTELANEGGKNTMLVSSIKLNIPIADTRFALPVGTQIIESQDAPNVGLPIMR
jgi:hypothetical protein